MDPIDQLYQTSNPDFWRAMQELDRAIADFNAAVDDCCEAINEFKANL